VDEQEKKPSHVSIDAAAKELGVNRSTMYYYLRQFEIEPVKFPLDRKSYLTSEDLERIQTAKREAEERSNTNSR